ncbi:Protein FAM50B like [Actinidia chinensis var. chinensis]|uniref:Protein FAM50B like n=1 Tax=Actinidia chinensis var. chinensis TaxID=1590841 RepID=A0A2R6QM00_ACTCC|nr:Protein FAM50B like [Actinidia chinensis var. chinensis]
MVERALTQMGRESSDRQVVIHSSIALLRERFMQLQREKEMRQRRELLRTLWESERYITNSSTISHYEPSQLFFFQTEILKPPPCQVSLALWPNSQIKHSNSFQGTEKPQVMKLWQPSTTDKPFVRAPPIKFNDSDSDVDTSLHL